MRTANSLVPMERITRPVGRPRIDDLPSTIERNLKAAGLLILAKWPAYKVADHMGASRASIYLWRKKALSYDTTEADILRRLAS